MFLRLFGCSEVNRVSILVKAMGSDGTPRIEPAASAITVTAGWPFNAEQTRFYISNRPLLETVAPERVLVEPARR
jgi:hypothetical protein